MDRGQAAKASGELCTGNRQMHILRNHQLVDLPMLPVFLGHGAALYRDTCKTFRLPTRFRYATGRAKGSAALYRHAPTYRRCLDITLIEIDKLL